MKIDKVQIHNCNAYRGEQWWAEVQSKPTEPLIKATITMTASWDEYSALLKEDSQRKDSK